MKYQGIDYKPDITYKLKDAPANEYIEELLELDRYTSPEDVAEIVDQNIANIDYLLDFIESELQGSTYNNVSFSEYQQIAIKKYYCQLPITSDEEQIVYNFESGAGGLDGDIRGDFYKRLLTMKFDQENDKSQLRNLLEIDTVSIESYLNKLSFHYQTDDHLEKIYDTKTKNNLYNKLYSLNNKIRYYEDKKKNLESSYHDALSNGHKEKAKLLKRQIEKIDTKLADIRSNVSFAASQSYIFHKKAEKTSSYLKKAGYLILATPFDHLGGKVCCMLKLLIKAVYGGEKNSLEEFYKDLEINKSLVIGGESYSLEDLIRAIDAIRGILAIAYGKDMRMANELANELTRMILSPFKNLLNNGVMQFRDFENKAMSRVVGLFDFIAETNPENPNGLLDCMYFEGVADIIFDVIEEIFEDIESKIVDLYKFTHQQTNNMMKDLVVVGKKEKIRQLYRLLTRFSKVLLTIDRFTFEKGIEEWIESFLIKSGFGTQYNAALGIFEPISLDGCIDRGRYQGSYRTGYPTTSEDIEDLCFNKAPNYSNFISNQYPKTYVCEI